MVAANASCLWTDFSCIVQRPCLQTIDDDKRLEAKHIWLDCETADAVRHEVASRTRAWHGRWQIVNYIDILMLRAQRISNDCRGNSDDPSLCRSAHTTDMAMRTNPVGHIYVAFASCESIPIKRISCSRLDPLRYPGATMTNIAARKTHLTSEPGPPWPWRHSAH